MPTYKDTCEMCNRARSPLDGKTACPFCGHIGKMNEGEFSHQIVRKAVSFIYNKLVNPLEKDAKLKQWMRENCDVFDSKSDEMKHEYYELYSTYERMIEELLQDFCTEQRLDDIYHLYDLCEEAVKNNVVSSKHLKMLLAASKFERFEKLMQKEKVSIF